MLPKYVSGYKEKTAHKTVFSQYIIIKKMAPQVGLEPTTLRLTAACSTDWAIEEHLTWEPISSTLLLY